MNIYLYIALPCTPPPPSKPAKVGEGLGSLRPLCLLHQCPLIINQLKPCLLARARLLLIVPPSPPSYKSCEHGAGVGGQTSGLRFCRFSISY